ncbi:MAG: polysaccharide deacetylase family protein [Bryobacteraceae bacterium]
MFRAVMFVLICVLVCASVSLLYAPTPGRLLWFALLFVPGNMLICYLVLHPRSQLMVRNRSRVESAGRRSIALTFDDGPSSANTEALLEILRRKRVKATFFVVGRRAEDRPDLLRAVLADGHAVGNHTYSHPSLFCFLSPRRLRAEIAEGQRVIAAVCGIRPRYFRSPVGLRHPLLSFYLKRAGLEYISWRVRAFDSRVQKPEVIRQRIAGRAAPGDIVLLHDSNCLGVARMLAVLPQLIDDLQQRGFEFVLV